MYIHNIGRLHVARVCCSSVRFGIFSLQHIRLHLMVILRESTGLPRSFIGIYQAGNIKMIHPNLREEFIHKGVISDPRAIQMGLGLRPRTHL